MIGFWKKDLFILRKYMRTYALILVAYAVLGISGTWGSSLMTTMISFVTLMCPLTAFSFDQATRWDGYACSLPDGGRGAVAGRYLYTLTIWLAAIGMCCVLSTVLWVTGLQESSLMEQLLGNLASGAVGLLMVSITLPMCYKFGVERGRVLMTVLCLFVFLGIMGGIWMIEGPIPEDVDVVTILNVGMAIFVAVTLVGFYVSYRVSRAIYLKKEW